MLFAFGVWRYSLNPHVWKEYIYIFFVFMFVQHTLVDEYSLYPQCVVYVHIAFSRPLCACAVLNLYSPLCTLLHVPLIHTRTTVKKRNKFTRKISLEKVTYDDHIQHILLTFMYFGQCSFLCLLSLCYFLDYYGNLFASSPFRSSSCMGRRRRRRKEGEKNKGKQTVCVVCKM